MATYIIYPTETYSNNLSVYPAETSFADVYTLVDDVYTSPDELSTYVYTADYSQYVTAVFVIDGPLTALGKINSITIHARCKNLTTNGGYAYVNMAVYAQSTHIWQMGGYDTTVALTTDWQDVTYEIDEFAVVSEEFEFFWSDFTNMLFSVNLKADSGGAVACTSLYLEVDYEPWSAELDDATLNFTKVILPVTLTVNGTDHLQDVGGITLMPDQLIMHDAYHEQYADMILFGVTIEDLANLDTFHLQYADGDLELVIESIPAHGDLDVDLPFLELEASVAPQGEITLPFFTITASGVLSPYIVGELTLPAFTAEGQSGIGGEFSFPPLEISGTAKTGDVGSASLQLPAFSAAGGVSAPVWGAASLTLSGASLTATATAGYVASVASPLPLFLVGASGAVGQIADVTLELPVFIVTGTAIFDVSCSLTHDLPFFEMDALASDHSRFTEYILRWIR